MIDNLVQLLYKKPHRSDDIIKYLICLGEKDKYVLFKEEYMFLLFVSWIERILKF